MPSFRYQGKEFEYEGPLTSALDQPILGAPPLHPNSVAFQRLLSDPCTVHLFDSAYNARSAETEAQRLERVARYKATQALRAEAGKTKGFKV